MSAHRIGDGGLEKGRWSAAPLSGLEVVVFDNYDRWRAQGCRLLRPDPGCVAEQTSGQVLMQLTN